MADVFDDDENETEQTVSLNEYLEQVEHQELEADLVLGGDEGKECTYAKGYMKRQAIFSCLTCAPDGNGGVCTACSLSCHDGHEIIELWTKRKFKCDCGNSKFGAGYCKLLPSKDSENEENAYNQNFKGKYCTCGRPYPDPDAEEQVEMIQCCICEDWFHEEHLGHESTNEVKIPVDEEGEPLYEDLICHKCSSICSFLHLYPPTIWASDKEHAATPSKEKDVAATPSKEKDVVSAPFASGSSSKLEDGTSDIRDADPAAVPDVNAKSPHDDKDVVLGEKSVTCLLGVDLSATELASEKSQPMFLAKNWREALCGCAKCSDFYAKKGISYLLDKEDSIAEYERMAKQKRDEKMQQQEGAELNLLNNLGHVEKLEILSGINDMKDEIRSFLQNYDASKPITSNDIHQVFENLKKRRRMD
ncbi:Zinc finger, FYVE/PHD-type [Artemisia annua]|uniref:Zinc finger, FYVE/PHD-type n=1 Tax=Artemisia annua TaxID=35608 RepID=A0A2U1LL42_ARTAN|nr:Zinc finger, FYVE/PHD-type [Artemisia annua]